MYVDHLQEMPDGRLQPLTTCGRYTRDHIRLGRRDLLNWRQLRRQRAQELETFARTGNSSRSSVIGRA